MKDFEARLKRLRLRAPSEDLDRRVLSQRPEAAAAPRARPRRRVPLGAAVAMSAAMGLAGFAAGLAARPGRGVTGPDAGFASAVPVEAPPVVVQVVYHSPSMANPFDFTSASDWLLPGKLQVAAQTMKGTGT